MTQKGKVIVAHVGEPRLRLSPLLADLSAPTIGARRGSAGELAAPIVWIAAASHAAEQREGVGVRAIAKFRQQAVGGVGRSHFRVFSKARSTGCGRAADLVDDQLYRSSAVRVPGALWTANPCPERGCDAERLSRRDHGVFGYKYGMRYFELVSPIDLVEAISGTATRPNNIQNNLKKKSDALFKYQSKLRDAQDSRTIAVRGSPSQRAERVAKATTKRADASRIYGDAIRAANAAMRPKPTGT